MDIFTDTFRALEKMHDWRIHNDANYFESGEYLTNLETLQIASLYDPKISEKALGEINTIAHKELVKHNGLVTVNSANERYETLQKVCYIATNAMRENPNIIAQG